MTVAIPEQQPPAMSSGEIAMWAQAASDAARLVSPLVRTDFVPAHFRGNVEAATAAVLFGAEAGLSPMQALQGVFVISGRPAMYSRTMLAIVLGKGHEVWVEDATESRVVVCGRRRGSEQVERAVWTIERARKAGYTSNKKYQTDPMAMLTARGHADICRRIAPDALLGMAYTVEELEDEQQDEARPAVRTVKRAAPRRAPARAAIEPSDGPLLPGEDVPAADPGEAITRDQSRKLHATLGDLGVRDRDHGLSVLSGLAGRPLESSGDLTKVEASRVIDALDRMSAADIEPAVDVEDPPLDDDILPLDGAEAAAEGQ